MNKDIGAKHIVNKFEKDVYMMEVSKKLQDVDTTEKYNKLYKEMNY